MVIATITVAMNRHNAAAIRSVATMRDTGRIAVNSGVTHTTMSDGQDEAQVEAQDQIMSFTGVSDSRSNIAKGITWSMTGAATT